MSEEIAMAAASGTMPSSSWQITGSRRRAAEGRAPEWNPVALERAGACLKIAAVVALQGGILALFACLEAEPPAAPTLDLSLGISAFGIGLLLHCAGRMLERLSLRLSAKPTHPFSHCGGSPRL
ncbi:MAG: hypothetical protein JO255_18545 [Alphaproteobacteria bacterium]|nr:hypothetical protein [Alphaproteobacteria bacterium]